MPIRILAVFVCWPGWLIEKKQRPSKRHAFATWNHWGADDPLRPSGLVGRVILRESRIIGTQ